MYKYFISSRYDKERKKYKVKSWKSITKIYIHDRKILILIDKPK